MAITFTSTRAGTSPDYLRYVYGDLQGLQKTDRFMDSVLLDFALAPVDSAFVRLDRGAYVVVDSTTYPKWFTGYITNEPECSYLGKDATGNPVFGYKYQATADEYILSLNPIGVVQPFLNQPMGHIIKSLAAMLQPGVFDFTNVADGPIVAQYVVTPDKVFSDVTTDLCTQAGYMFYGNDHKLYFKPQDDAGLGSITIDGSNTHYTPSRLTLNPSSAPILNDVTVLGKLEPQTYMHEYFVGTGLESAFPLTAGVWGADTCILLQDQFQQTNIDQTIWSIYDSGELVDNAPSNLLQVFNGYLNVLGGTADGSNGLWMQSVSAIPMDSRLRFTHGEFDFLGGGNGVICSIWKNAPNPDLTGCLYGLSMSGLTVHPIVNGVVDDTQFVTFSGAMRYVIRTVAEFTKAVRVPNQYTYLASDGTIQSVSSGLVEPDTVTWQTIVSEVDPATGTLTDQWLLQNTSTLTGVDDTYAIYVPFASDSLHFTVGNITVSIPVNCTLETATALAIVNGGFDDWPDNTHPSGWYDPTNIALEQLWGASGNALSMANGASIKQDVSKLLLPNTTYNCIFQVANLNGTPSGTITITLSGTGMTSQSFVIDTSTLVFHGWYVTVTGLLMTPIPAIPANAVLTISYAGSTNVLIDSLTILSSYQHQLVGPNEMDAMDGLAPVATIVSGNMNSQTKSTYMGHPQYNPGQDQLVFFKNSVTLTSNVPPENQIFRLSYRAAGSAVGRVLDSTSVTTEASLWGDNGVRSIVRTDLQPRPRTSLECELAAKAVVGESSYQHYEGTYTQFSPYFTAEPKSGMPLKFTNMTGIPFITAEEATEVQTTILSQTPQELFSHQISFGKPDHLRRFLAKVTMPIDAYQQNPVSPYADPSFVDVADVATNYIEDIRLPFLRNWDDRYIYIDIGQDLPSDATAFEIRYTDDNWNNGTGKNLVSRTTSRFVTVQRNPRGRTFFIRAVGANGLTSRYSSCVNVAFPVVQSNAYIRDWNLRVIDTASPLVVGEDLSQNRYRISIDQDTQITLDEWLTTVKTAPTAGPLGFDLLRSQDGGQTWASIFPSTQKPFITAGTISGEGTQFFTRFLVRDDLIRYDCTAADGVGGGFELALEGRVFTQGNLPVGQYYGSGTGQVGAISGGTSADGTVVTGILAEYLLKEDGGTIVHDSSGLLRNGEFNTTQPSWDTNQLGLDMGPGHTQQSVVLPNSTMAIDSSSVRDFTAEAWINASATGPRGGYAYVFSGSALQLFIGDDGYHFIINGQQLFAASPLPYGSWKDVVVTRSGSTVTAYANGVQIASGTLSATPLALGTGGKYLGGDPTNTSLYSFPGELGEVRLYGNALTADQVLANYNARKGVYDGSSAPDAGDPLTPNGTGSGSSGSGSGSTPSTGVAAQIYGDMTGSNEAHPHGVPSNYSFYSGPVVEQGNSIGSNTAIEAWGGMYVPTTGNPATNTSVAVKNMQVWWLRNSTGQWVQGMAPTSGFDGGYYNEDFSGSQLSSISFTTQGDGSKSFTTVSGHVAHIFAPFPRIGVDNTDFGGVVIVAEAQLVLTNPAGTDDRSSAQFLLTIGGDYYPSTTGGGINQNPGIGGGKLKFVQTTWRSFSFTTLSLSELTANPPPIDLTGISS